MSGERKTAELFLKQVEDIIEILKTEWQVNVVAFTSDASGESRKARKLLREKCPWIVTLDCYAHQVSHFYTIISFI